MGRFLDSIKPEALYSGDASDGVKLYDSISGPIRGFAAIDESCFSGSLLSLLLHYSPDQIRVHMLALSTTSVVFEPLNVIREYCKGRDAVDVIVASGNEGDYGFIQIESATATITLSNMSERLRNIYTDVVCLACATATTLTERRKRVIDKHPTATTWEDVQRDANAVFEISTNLYYRDLVFIDLRGIALQHYSESEFPEFLALIDILYKLKEYSGCTVIFITNKKNYLEDSELWKYVEYIVTPTEEADKICIGKNKAYVTVEQPVVSEEDIIECFKKDSELCEKFCTSEWR